MVQAPAAPSQLADFALLRAGFAVIEALIVLAAVLQHFEVQPLPGTDFPAAEPRITLRPGPVKLFLRPRR